jgi:pilus assembly protein FimV
MQDKIALIPEGWISTRRGPLWKKTVLATAAALSLLGLHSSAHALALGAAQVKSALGEPLRAEVEVPNITSQEAMTFRATLGKPQEFQAAGVDYNGQALRGLRIILTRRPNGQAYLRVQGMQPVNEPFLSLVINANWAGGRAARDYTLLIDPPRKQAAASEAAPAQQQNTPVISPPRPSRADSGTAPASAAAPSASPASGDEQVQVQTGDTASSILAAHPVQGVSLDQMLVALLQANPRAFIRGNVNLIRAGAVINMPSADQAAAVSPQSARQMLTVQSRNFHTYRQGLATTTAQGGAIATTSGRSVAGNVQSQVRETSAAPEPPDRLKLSRSQPGSSAPEPAGTAETRIAQSRLAQEQAAREAELHHNISELSKLVGTGGGSAAPASPSKPSTTGGKAPSAPAAPAAPVATASATSKAAASTPPADEATSAPASAAAAATKPQPAPHHPAAPPAPHARKMPAFMDTLLSPFGLGGAAAALILLLGGYGLYRSRQKNSGSATKLDSDLFSDSKLPPDSYFGVSGGQRVDTRDDSSTGASSSMAYSPSQLEAVGDIDPVSEADVYLAYGRDAQAEEILKEALRTYPGRPSIYVKLAEIYAKQRDAGQLEAIATQAHRVTHGEGHDWQAIINLGKSIDPANPLYAPGHASAPKKPPAPQQSPAFSMEPDAPSPAAPSPDGKNSLDLDLTDNAPLSTSAPTQPTQPTSPGQRSQDTPPASYPSTVPAASPISFDDIDLSLPAPGQPPNFEALKFETSGFPDSPVQVDPKQTDEDPLSTKLGLAQEFHAIGDDSSALALVKEVLAEATGALKTKAEQLLKDLG